MKDYMDKNFQFIMVVLSFVFLFTTLNVLGGTVSMLLISFYLLLIGLFYKRK